MTSIILFFIYEKSIRKYYQSAHFYFFFCAFGGYPVFFYFSFYRTQNFIFSFHTNSHAGLLYITVNY